MYVVFCLIGLIHFHLFDFGLTVLKGIQGNLHDVSFTVLLLAYTNTDSVEISGRYCIGHIFIFYIACAKCAAITKEKSSSTVNKEIHMLFLF